MKILDESNIGILYDRMALEQLFYDGSSMTPKLIKQISCNHKSRSYE